MAIIYIPQTRNFYILYTRTYSVKQPAWGYLRNKASIDESPTK